MIDVKAYIESRHFTGYRISRGMQELCHDDQPYELPRYAREIPNPKWLSPTGRLPKGVKRYYFSGKRPSGVSILVDRVEGRSMVYATEKEARIDLAKLNAMTDKV